MNALLCLLLLLPFAATAYNCTGYCAPTCADISASTGLLPTFVTGTCVPFCVKECDALLNANGSVAVPGAAAAATSQFAVATPQFASTTYVMNLCGRAPTFTQTGATVTAASLQVAYAALGAALGAVTYGSLAFGPAVIVPVTVNVPCAAGVPVTCDWAGWLRQANTVAPNRYSHDMFVFPSTMNANTLAYTCTNSAFTYIGFNGGNMTAALAQPSQIGMQTYDMHSQLHEIGHALGLLHSAALCGVFGSSACPIDYVGDRTCLMGYWNSYYVNVAAAYYLGVVQPVAVYTGGPLTVTVPAVELSSRNFVMIAAVTKGGAPYFVSYHKANVPGDVYSQDVAYADKVYVHTTTPVGSRTTSLLVAMLGVGASFKAAGFAVTVVGTTGAAATLQFGA